MSFKIIIKNNRSYDVRMDDLGVVFEASSQFEIYPQLTLPELQRSTLYARVSSGDLTVNDGVSDLSIADTRTFLDDPKLFRFTKYNLGLFASAFGVRFMSNLPKSNYDAVLASGLAGKSSNVVSAIFPVVAFYWSMTKAEKDEIAAVHSANAMFAQYSVVPLSFAAITNFPSSATAGVAYSWTATADASVTAWSLGDGSTLPTGLSLNSDTGEISGTPTVVGAYNFTLQTLRTDPYLPYPFNQVRGAAALTITVS